ncbi:CHAT domain-containing protein [candidate division KSB1 bacterium]|nr:CHAT domain-containing protein [candidate division KSB1 bacterium]
MFWQILMTSLVIPHVHIVLLIQINFFENWLNFGHDKAEALRQAQLNMINLLKNNPIYDFPHPYFWAAATLTGSTIEASLTFFPTNHPNCIPIQIEVFSSHF